MWRGKKTDLLVKLGDIVMSLVLDLDEDGVLLHFLGCRHGCCDGRGVGREGGYVCYLHVFVCVAL